MKASRDMLIVAAGRSTLKEPQLSREPQTLTEEATPSRAPARRVASRRRQDGQSPADAPVHDNGHFDEGVPASEGGPDNGPASTEQNAPASRVVRRRRPANTPEGDNTTDVTTQSTAVEDRAPGLFDAQAPEQATNGPAPTQSRPFQNDSRERDNRPPQQQGGGNEPRNRPDRWGRRDRRDRNQRANERRFERSGGMDRYDRYEDEFERESQASGAAPPLNIAELETMPREELIETAIAAGIEDASTMRKPDLIFRMLQSQAEARGNIFTGGFLEVSDDGNYGFLRGESMLPGAHDIYVSQTQLRRFALRAGDYVTGQVRQPRDNEKYYGLLKVEAVNGIDPETAKRRPYFENLTHRIIDLIAPIGKGSRGLIVSPPKAGKTMLLKNIANGITANHPDVHLIVLLVGERPEEVTDMKRSVRGEVVSSTFDEPVEDHTRVAEMALERAKRLVEGGRDVVILMDSITRLTRAYNLALPPSGRTLSGGVDPIALYPPKRLFGAARKCEEAGSLTILATCLVDTGSRMDEVVFEEFKGTGNLELRLDRKLAERRFYPAIDLQASSTRREELLLDEKTLKGVWLVRRMTAMISQNSPNQLEATERLLERLARTTTNEEFITGLKTDL